jgi:hypothetical protein
VNSWSEPDSIANEPTDIEYMLTDNHDAISKVLLFYQVQGSKHVSSVIMNLSYGDKWDGFWDGFVPPLPVHTHVIYWVKAELMMITEIFIALAIYLLALIILVSQ